MTFWKFEWFSNISAYFFIPWDTGMSEKWVLSEAFLCSGTDLASQRRYRE